MTSLSAVSRSAALSLSSLSVTSRPAIASAPGGMSPQIPGLTVPERAPVPPTRPEGMSDEAWTVRMATWTQYQADLQSAATAGLGTLRMASLENEVANLVTLQTKQVTQSLNLISPHARALLDLFA